MPRALFSLLLLLLSQVAGAAPKTELRDEDVLALQDRLERLKAQCPLEALVLKGKGTQPPRDYYRCMAKAECFLGDLRYDHAPELQHPALQAALSYVEAHMAKGNEVASRIESGRPPRKPGELPENLFAKALQRKELVEFAAGQGQYFLFDREYYACGGHWVVEAWARIASFCDGRSDCGPYAATMLSGLLDAKALPLEERMGLLVYHLHNAYYLKKEGRLDVTGALRAVEKAVIARVPECRRILRARGDEKELENFESFLERIQANGGLKGLPR